MKESKDIIISELREQIESYTNSYNQLRAEYHFMDPSPTKRYRIEQRMKEASAQKETAEKLLEKYLQQSGETKGNGGILAEPVKIKQDDKNTNRNPKEIWRKIVKIIVPFYLSHWKWLWTSAIAICGIIIVIIKEFFL